MNDVDQEVRTRLRGLVDPEPVDAAGALESVHASRRGRRDATPRHHIGLVVALTVVGVLGTMVLVSRSTTSQPPPYRLIGAVGANVVVRIESSGNDPRATLTVGDTTILGPEIAGTPTSNGVSFGSGVKLPAEPKVEVPDGSSLRVEGNFDSASASSVPWISLGPDGAGGVNVLNVGTWQLDGSGGSVVFMGHDGDVEPLLVEAVIGGIRHYFYFRVHIAPMGG